MRGCWLGGLPGRIGAGGPAGGAGASPGAYVEDLTYAGVAALTDARVRRWWSWPAGPRGRTIGAED